MRLALGGGVGSLEPLVLTLSTGNFAKAEYVALGYTYYDVLCVGAAGGFGGGCGGGVLQRDVLGSVGCPVSAVRWHVCVRA